MDLPTPPNNRDELLNEVRWRIDRFRQEGALPSAEETQPTFIDSLSEMTRDRGEWLQALEMAVSEAFTRAYPTVTVSDMALVLGWPEEQVLELIARDRFVTEYRSDLAWLQRREVRS